MSSVYGGRYDPLNLQVSGPFQDFNFKFPPDVPNVVFSNETTSFVSAQMNWKETAEAHVFKAELPGLKKDEVKVEVEEGRVLCISGERKMEKEEKTVTWHRVERSSGKFLRRFRLPENTKFDKITACLENGVLTVTVPKVETKKPLSKTVHISGY